MACLALEGLCHSTIIFLESDTHILRKGLHWWDGKTGAGAEGCQARAKTRKGTGDNRLPMTPELMLKLREVWEKNSGDPDNIMLWAASTLCFFGFMRAGDLTVPSDKSFDDSSHLTCKDVSVDSIETPKVY